MSAAALTPSKALIGIGAVRHARRRPVRNSFAYKTWFVLLPLRRLREQPDPALPRNRFAAVSFHDSDHGDGGDDCLAWIDALLHRHGVTGADGEIWLHCLPRVLGYAFKPVSFWYCHDRAGALAAIVVEVNNTFGERHCYLLRGDRLASGRELRADKSLYVSPFCTTQGEYRFRFLRTDASAELPARTLVRIDHHDCGGLLLETSVSGRLEPLTRASLRRAFFAMPLLTLAVVARIHSQALRLWLRRVPVVKKPAPPALLVTESTST